MLRRSRTKVLLQSQIEAAMRVTRSNMAAAEYLRVSYTLYCKFAKTYKNSQGLTLFQAHKNQAGRGIIKGMPSPTRFSLDDILLGKHPQYPLERLFQRMVVSGYIAEQCNHCGYALKRPTDQKTPLVMHPIDGDKTNHRRSNLELLCYNCYFMLVGDLRTVKKVYDRPEHELEKERQMLSNPSGTNDFEILSDEEKINLIKSLASHG